MNVFYFFSSEVSCIPQRVVSAELSTASPFSFLPFLLSMLSVMSAYFHSVGDLGRCMVFIFLSPFSLSV